jgi:hypothetical protein
LENPYQAAMRKTLKFLDYYDSDGFIPFFGFGAKMPPFKTSVSHCFAVNGHIFSPEERGINNLMKAYTDCLKQISFHGPNALAPLINFIGKMAAFKEVT